jgi:hypothetical protein
MGEALELDLDFLVVVLVVFGVLELPGGCEAGERCGLSLDEDAERTSRTL